jgi:predicted Na+-dependent transporter
MSRKFKDDSDAQFFFIMFLMVIIFIIIVVTWKYIMVKAPDMNSEEGRCQAFCAGIGVKSLGYSKDKVPLQCFCDNPPVPPNEKLLRRP